MKLMKEAQKMKALSSDLLSFLMVGLLVFVTLLLVEPFTYGMRAGVSMI